jgi:formylglycine-generating enzyme required for sulfatase activity
MTRIIALVAASAWAATASAITIATVPVENANNPADLRYDVNGFGSVAYSYRMSKYEVTNAQYVGFLNAVDPLGANSRGLYSSFMTSDAHGGITLNAGAANGLKYEVKTGRGNNPVVFVSWYDAIRFANWMHNGQGTGDTENGAYTVGPVGSGGVPINGNSITRSSAAKWWLPSEDEWYKAAYHKNDGVTGNYWDYPTSTDAVPYSDQPLGTDAPDQSNTANFFRNDNVTNNYDDGFAVTGSATIVHSQNYLTDVGAYALSTSPYGTYDQGGNVGEWNEAIIFGSFRGFRGGWFSDGEALLRASNRGNLIANGASGEDGSIMGFRVATAIPEPSALLLTITAFATLPTRRRKSVPHNRV